MLQEELARLRDELVVADAIERFIADQALRRFGPVLVGVALEVGHAGLRAAHQHLVDARHGVAHIGEEFVFAADRTAMLAGVAAVGLDAVDLHGVGVELQHLGVLLIDPGDGVEAGHGHRCC